MKRSKPFNEEERAVIKKLFDDETQWNSNAEKQQAIDTLRAKVERVFIGNVLVEKYIDFNGWLMVTKVSVHNDGFGRTTFVLSGLWVFIHKGTKHQASFGVGGKMTGSTHLYPSMLDNLRIATVDEFKTVYQKILTNIANMQNTIDAHIELMASLNAPKSALHKGREK